MERSSEKSQAYRRISTRKRAGKTPVGDSEHSYQLHYDHGFLQTHTLGAILAGEEILTVMNTVSTSDQGENIPKSRECGE
jgi:hypothetical protein